MGHAGLVRAAGGLTMRAPVSDLPLVVDDVSLQAGATTILNRLSLTITAGAPPRVLGPPTAGGGPFLPACPGALAPALGRPPWGGRAGRARSRPPPPSSRPPWLGR